MSFDQDIPRKRDASNMLQQVSAVVEGKQLTIQADGFPGDWHGLGLPTRLGRSRLVRVRSYLIAVRGSASPAEAGPPDGAATTGSVRASRGCVA